MIAVAMPYFNRHLGDLMERVGACSGSGCRYLVWQDMPVFRRGNNWTQPSTVSKIGPLGAFYSLGTSEWLRAAHAFVFLGFFDPFPAMPWLISRALSTGKPVYVATEGLRRHNLLLLRRGVFGLLRGRYNGRLLAIGSGCAEDYRRYGLDWPALSFGYAEDPLPGAGVQRPEPRAGSALRLLAVGQLIPRKRYDWLIRLVASLAREIPLELRICGEGEQSDELYRLAESLSAPVRFEGFASGATLARHYQWADVFVHPASYEGWGVVLNHALSFALPIVAGVGVRSGNGVLVRPGWNGFVCRTDEDYARAVRQLHANSALRREFSRHSAELAVQWEPEHLAQRLATRLAQPAVNYPLNEPLSNIPT